MRRSVQSFCCLSTPEAQLCHALVLGVVGLCLPAAAQSSYSIADLGSLGGDETTAYGINSSGRVVGCSVTAAGNHHAFLYTPGQGIVDIGTLGGLDSCAYGINAKGEVAGEALTSTNTLPHAFLYSSGGMKDLGDLGGNRSWARGINAGSQVVGDAFTSDGAPHPVIFNPGITNLGSLGGNAGRGNGINALGHAVGGSSTGTRFHAFLYLPGQAMIDIDVASSGGSEALGVNDGDQIVGYFADASFRRHAFIRYSSQEIVDLGTLGGSEATAKAINNLGAVVGSSRTSGDADEHGFLYAVARGMLDVNTLLPSGSGWILQDATAINDTGQITGWGLHNGQIRAYLLTPAGTGTIQVTTNLAAASFTINGPGTFAGSGTSFNQTNAPAGDYTITFQPVAGFTTPSPQMQTLTAGGTITFTGSYQVGMIHLSLTLAQPSIVPSNFTDPSQPKQPSVVSMTANVTDAMGHALSNYQVKFEITTVDATVGGHTHTTPPPRTGDIDDVSTNPPTSTNLCTTDAAGNCQLSYVAPETSGHYAFVASLIANPTIFDTKTLDVGLLNTLNPLPPGTGLALTGCGILCGQPTTSAGACPGTVIQHPSNHFGTAIFLVKVQELARIYNAKTGGVLGINDMSLILGGLFDICNNWTRPHNLHRRGRSVDIDHPSDLNPVLLENLAGKLGLTKIIEGPIHYELYP